MLSVNNFVCIFANLFDALKKLEKGMENLFFKQLSEFSAETGLSLTKLASLCGLTNAFFYNYKNGRTIGAPKANILQKLVEIGEEHGVSRSIDWFTRGIDEHRPPIQLVGRVGASDPDTPKVTYFDDHYIDPHETAPHIAGAMYKNENEKTVAVEIVGKSIGRFFDGWYAYYNTPPRDPTSDMLGQLCVVWEEDGCAYIKELHKGQNGTFNLKSEDGTMLINQKIQSAALVIGIAKKKEKK